MSTHDAVIETFDTALMDAANDFYSVEAGDCISRANALSDALKALLAKDNVLRDTIFKVLAKRCVSPLPGMLDCDIEVAEVVANAVLGLL